MFGAKKDKQVNRDDVRKVRRNNMPQLGLLDMSADMDLDNIGNDYDDEVDESLEAELLALTSGKLPPRPKRTPRAPADLDELNKMIAESMKDDEAEAYEDEDLENDPTLVAELLELTPDDDGEPMVEPAGHDSAPPLPPRISRPAPSVPVVDSKPSIMQVIEERISAYDTALASAKSLGETSKIRRYERGLKTLQSLLKAAKSGKDVNEDELPPMVAASSAKPTPAPQHDEIPEAYPQAVEGSELARKPLPPLPMDVEQSKPVEETVESSDSHMQDDSSEDIYKLLVSRRDQYKLAALAAKRNNDTQTAISYIKVVKQFEAVIEAQQQGQPIDLSRMPPPPPEVPVTSNTPNEPVSTPRSMNASQGSAAPEFQPTANQAATEPEDTGHLFNAPAAPTSTLDALEQRFQKYKLSQQEAQEQGNGSKARRLGRIVKQYEDAIKLHKAGKPVPFDDLPDPPGFAPIPRGDAASSAPARPAANSQPQLVPKSVPQPDTRPAQPAPNSAVQKPAANAVPAAAGTAGPPAPPPRQRPAGAPKPAPVKRPQALHEKQLATIQERQRLFREAAIEAKKRGDLQAAKEYLRLSKGFAPMIEAAKCGLPVNIESSPVPPQLMVLKRDESFEVVDYEDCAPPGDRDEAFDKLDQELTEQILMCNRNAKHFSQVGDVSSCQKFVKMGENTRKDLIALQHARKRGEAVPRFHYETRAFSMIRCFTDLTDNDLDLTIIRGINFNCPNPKDIDTYVKFEFPFPSETPARDRTHTIKDTNNPEYNQSFVLPINRKARNLARVFKRGHIKLEVIAKGGFLRSDNVFGTAQVKLAPLETKCLIHATFDIMDGRKPVGGKLEVKVRIREPLLTKQVEEVKEKWLVIDQYVVK